MTELWTPEDELAFRWLKRKYDRIHAKDRRDKTRVRPFKSRVNQSLNAAKRRPKIEEKQVKCNFYRKENGWCNGKDLKCDGWCTA